MSANLTMIRNNYIRDLPSEVPAKAAQGFIATATIKLIAGASGKIALAGGAIAVIATMIEALTRPIIRAIFPNQSLITQAIQIVVPKMMALGLVSTFAPWAALSCEVHSFGLSVIAWLALNNGFYQRNVGMAQIV